MLRTLAFSPTVAAVAAAALVTAATASTAFAGETGYAPPPNYAPAPTYAPPPNYAPPPAPPPAQGYAPAPQQQYYAQPQPAPYAGPGAYAPPPQPTYGYRPGGQFEIDRQGGTIAGILGFGGYGSGGFGIGVEGGYSLPSHVYLGGNFTYFADTYGGYLVEFQGGYDLAVIPRAPVLIRPYAGLGYEHISGPTANQEACQAGVSLACTSGGGGAFIFSLGAVGNYFFTRNWFAGVDLRLDIVTSGYGYVGFDGFAMGGYKF